MSNKLLICEVFESKPALFYDDSQYYLDKIGSFVASEFDITIGNISTATTGTISIPQNVQLSQPIKVGDIVQIMPVNFRNHTKAFQNIGVNGSADLLDGNVWRRCFSVKSVDGGQLLLTDYFEYMLTYTNVGYVGNVNNENFYKILELLTQRELRAYASKLYTYDTVGGSVTLPLRITIPDGSVSFYNEFENTNVSPYSVLLSVLSSKSITKDRTTQITMGSVIRQDQNGYYVTPYIIHRTSEGGAVDGVVDEVLRLVPGASTRTVPLQASNAATVWVQNQDNGDDYVRAGLVVCSKTNDTVTLSKLSDLTPAQYTGSGITSIPSVLVGYNELFTNTDEETNNKNKQKHPKMTKALLADIINAATGKTVTDEVVAQMGEAVKKLLLEKLTPEYTPLILEIQETDYFMTDNPLEFETFYRIYWDNRFGVSISGVLAVVTAIRYTQAGRVYILETVEG